MKTVPGLAVALAVGTLVVVLAGALNPLPAQTAPLSPRLSVAPPEWRVVDPGFTPSGLFAISMLSSDEGWAVGQGGAILH